MNKRTTRALLRQGKFGKNRFPGWRPRLALEADRATSPFREISAAATALPCLSPLEYGINLLPPPQATLEMESGINRIGLLDWLGGTRMVSDPSSEHMLRLWAVSHPIASASLPIKSSAAQQKARAWEFTEQDEEDAVPAGTGQFNPEDLDGFSIHST